MIQTLSDKGELVYFELCIRLILAAICGLLMGLERSRRYKGAGLRTHITACCAAALFMIISKYGFSDLIPGELGTRGSDSARIAAGVVSGISFLCGGVIIKVGNGIHGLNTAVGIWFTAAIGLAIGSGLYVIAGFATLLCILFQLGSAKIKIGRDTYHNNKVKMITTSEFDFDNFCTWLIENSGGVIQDVSQTYKEDEAVFEFEFKTHESIKSEKWQDILKSNEGIKSVSSSSIDIA